MSKMSELAATIEELRHAVTAITEAANWLTEAFSGKTETPAPTPKEPEKQLTLEEVRAVLAEKSRMGYTTDVRKLLQKYGAAKLSQIDPANYKALLSDAEVLGHAD